MKSSAKRRAQRSSSGSPISSWLSRTRSSATENGIQLYSAIRYSRGRPAVRRRAATPSGPTTRSTKGMRPFVKMQLISGGIACYLRASRIRLNGVSVARRKRLNPASANTSRRRASPACAPRPSPTSWDSEFGVQTMLDAA